MMLYMCVCVCVERGGLGGISSTSGRVRARSYETLVRHNKQTLNQPNKQNTTPPHTRNTTQHHHQQISKSQKETGENHAVSALKFGIIKRFLQLGWAVLLSDLDIAVLQDPFQHLYRWVFLGGELFL